MSEHRSDWPKENREPICKGSIALGSACRRCARCQRELAMLAAMAKSTAVDPSAWKPCVRRTSYSQFQVMDRPFSVLNQYGIRIHGNDGDVLVEKNGNLEVFPPDAFEREFSTYDFNSMFDKNPQPGALLQKSLQTPAVWE